MKKRNWLYVLLILVCLAVFYGYQTMDRMRTDTTAPEIKMDAQIPEISVQDPNTALLQGITATDDVDGNVTNSLVVERIDLLDSDGNITVVCAAFDSAGNVAKADRSARFMDYESPKFTLNEPLAYPYGTSFDILSTVGAQDVLDGDIQHRIKATSVDENSIAMLGTHNVWFQVTNSLGDTVSQMFPVDVYDADMYDASLTLTEYLIYLPKGAAFVPQNYLATFTLRGEEVNLHGGLPRDYSLRTNGEVKTQEPGTYAVDFRVTYVDRHETNPEYDKSYTGYSKMIVVVEE